MKNYSNSAAVNREISEAHQNEAQTVKREVSEMRYVYLILACATLLAIGLSLAGLVPNN